MGVLFSLGLGRGAGTVAAFDEKAESQKSLAIPSHQFAPPFLYPFLSLSSQSLTAFSFFLSFFPSFLPFLPSSLPPFLPPSLPPSLPSSLPPSSPSPPPSPLSPTPPLQNKPKETPISLLYPPPPSPSPAPMWKNSHKPTTFEKEPPNPLPSTHFKLHTSSIPPLSTSPFTTLTQQPNQH